MRIFIINMPLFSVIIPTYNRFSIVTRAIESVLGQSSRDFRIILVDDGSTDDTPMLEEKYRGRITYIRQENSGVSSARNRGIKASSSRYITFLDSDDTWEKEKLSTHLEYIKANPCIPLHQTEEIWIRNGRRVNPRNRHKKTGGNIFIESLELCLISPSAVCIDVELFDRYGLFDEKMPSCEDYDLWLRITAQEKTGIISDYNVKKYYGHNDQLSRIFWGMDRFRVYSIIKLLENYSGKIRTDYEEAAVKTLNRKSEILLEGAEKRSNRKLLEIMKRITGDTGLKVYNSRYAETLLTL